MKWILCLLIGFIVSLIAFCNNLVVENLAGNYWDRFVSAFVVFAASNFGLTLFACLITAFIAPGATGSGIPEVKAYLNGVDAPAIFSLKTLLVKIVGSIAAVSSSLHIGGNRESQAAGAAGRDGEERRRRKE